MSETFFEYGIQRYFPDEQQWKTTILSTDKSSAEYRLKLLRENETDERVKYRLIHMWRKKDATV